MEERTIDVYWEGPYAWGDHNKHTKESHVLYALYGTHPLYGRDVLLYIGKTERDVGVRLSEHGYWTEYECDRINIRVASIGEIESWKDWEEGERYERAPDSDVEGVEALLIYAHQPAYNTRNKESLEKARNIRIFNTGHFGSLLPELSHRYYSEDW